MATDQLTYFDFLKAAKGSDKFFHSIMEGFPQGIIITDMEDKILYANFKMAQLTGYSRKELEGKILHLFLHYPDEQEKLTAILKQRITGIYESYELSIRKKNGSRFLGYTVTAPYKDEAETIIGTISIISDHSSYRREAELKALALAATKSLNAVIITDKYGKIEWVNEGFTKLSGYQLYEVIDTSGEAFRGDENDYFLQKLSEAVQEKKSKVFECKNYHKSGLNYWVKCISTPILDEYGGIKEIVITETDITEHRLLAEELSLVNNKMADSIKRSNKMLSELRKAKERVEQHTKEKERIFDDLKTKIGSSLSKVIGLVNALKSTKFSCDQSKACAEKKIDIEELEILLKHLEIECGKKSL